VADKHRLADGCLGRLRQTTKNGRIKDGEEKDAQDRYL